MVAGGVHLLPARAIVVDIAGRPREEQDFLLGWTQRISTTNIEIAYRFAVRAGGQLARMDRHLLEAWALHAMDAYDREGLRPGLLVIDRVENFARLHHEHTAGVLLDEVRGVLLTFVRGLSGRALKLSEGDAIYTDSETLFLPPVISRMPSAEDNFRLAKASVASCGRRPGSAACARIWSTAWRCTPMAIVPAGCCWPFGDVAAGSVHRA